MARIFAHRGILGMSAFVPDENKPGELILSPAVVNDVEDQNQLGVVCSADKCEISQEALDIMKSIPKGRDCIGDIDVFGDKENISIAWLGPLIRMIDPTNSDTQGSRDHDPSLIEHLSVVPNCPPEDFVNAVDSMMDKREAAEA